MAEHGAGANLHLEAPLECRLQSSRSERGTGRGGRGAQEQGVGCGRIELDVGAGLGGGAAGWGGLVDHVGYGQQQLQAISHAVQHYGCDPCPMASCGSGGGGAGSGAAAHPVMMGRSRAWLSQVTEVVVVGGGVG